jgi:hypothetical protein
MTEPLAETPEAATQSESLLPLIDTTTVTRIIFPYIIDLLNMAHQARTDNMMFSGNGGFIWEGEIYSLTMAVSPVLHVNRYDFTIDVDQRPTTPDFFNELSELLIEQITEFIGAHPANEKWAVVAATSLHCELQFVVEVR